MKKIFFYLLALSHVFGQSVIDTLSVTIYPEFSYPGVAIEYKFDKIGNDELIFPIPSSIDSVLYTISGNDVEFEQILETKNNSLTALNKDGNHTIYLFLDKFISETFVKLFGFNMLFFIYFSVHNCNFGFLGGGDVSERKFSLFGK